MRNDAISVSEVSKLNPERIVISPGPCTPSQAGVSCKVIEQFHGRKPILGICLGHQAIAQTFGAKIVKANEPFHGRQSTLTHDGHPIFRNVPQKFEVCRYHSLVVDQLTLPNDFTVTAETADGTVMAIADDSRMLFGLQFHPESILTPFGFQMLLNFLEISNGPNQRSVVPSNSDTVPGNELFRSESRSNSLVIGARR